MSSIRCSECNNAFSSIELEAHVCTEHLEYYPYGCSHCNHWLPTEEALQFHAQKKQHIPVKIRENLDIVKEGRMHEIINSSTTQQTIPNEGQQNLSQWQFGGIVNNIGSPVCGQVGQGDSSRHTSTPGSTLSNSQLVKSTDEQSVDVKLGNRKNPEKVETELGKEEISKKQTDDVKLCNICQIDVKTEDLQSHSKSHFKARPLAGCNYCSFTGKNNCSVKVHIAWRHNGKSKKVGIGVKDLKKDNSCMDEVFNSCFGEQMHRKTSMNEISKSARSTSSAGRVRKTTGKVVKSRLKLPFQNTKTSKKHLITRKSVSGRLDRRSMKCKECGFGCTTTHSSRHIYRAHINVKDMVRCQYCDYSNCYDAFDVKRHIKANHPNRRPIVIDRRREPDVQNLYAKWRARCFPVISNRAISSKKQVKPNEKKESNIDNIWSKLFSKKYASPKTNKKTKESSFNTKPKKPCIKCGEEVAVFWMRAHIWKHLSDDYGIHGLKCAVKECSYTTYIRRSLECHCRQIHGSTSQQLGMIDQRNKHCVQYKKCMTECFGNDLPQESDDNWMHNGAQTIQTAISTTIVEIWCQKCKHGIDKNEVEDHIWQTHLDGVLPIQCGKCNQYFLDLTKMESHWMNDHTGCGGETEVTEQPYALGLFENMLAECFPEGIAQQSQIKVEV